MAKKRKLHVEFYLDTDDNWRWHAKARNGRIVADSGEGYKRLASAVRGADAATVSLIADRGLAADLAKRAR